MVNKKILVLGTALLSGIIAVVIKNLYFSSAPSASCPPVETFILTPPMRIMVIFSTAILFVTSGSMWWQALKNKKFHSYCFAIGITLTTVTQLSYIGLFEMSGTFSTILAGIVLIVFYFGFFFKQWKNN